MQSIDSYTVTERQDSVVITVRVEDIVVLADDNEGLAQVRIPGAVWPALKQALMMADVDELADDEEEQEVRLATPSDIIDWSGRAA